MSLYLVIHVNSKKNMAFICRLYAQSECDARHNFVEFQISLSKHMFYLYVYLYVNFFINMT